MTLLARLTEVLDYKRDLGCFYWKAGHRSGLRAGCIGNHGYEQIKALGVLYLTHRLIWLFENGVSPQGIMLDHADTNRLNNRFDNLRVCTFAQNSTNSRLSKASKTGRKGVYFEKSRNKYKAQISVNGKSKFLGRFLNKDDAHAAYISAVVEIHPSFARAG